MSFSRKAVAVAAFSSVLLLSGCGYNDFQRLDEGVKSGWSEVLNQYQRRSDLIPNIVATVKGEASFEQDTLTKVIEARSKATSIQATPELVNNPEAFKKFQDAQGQLTGALSRLMVVLERASITLVRVSCSKLASPLTVATMLGMRSARRWYWFSTSLQPALTCSSRRWKSL